MKPSLLAALAFLPLPLLAQGGGARPTPTAQPCLSPAAHARVLDRVAEYARATPPTRKAAARSIPTQLVNPVRLHPDAPLHHAYGISNFVDHDAAAEGNQYGATNRDYACGKRTYDLASGYNHSGTDYFAFPYPFWLMDNDYVEVVAAAPGTLIGKDDGNFDRNCGSFEDEADWNAVYVRHADGSVAWYGHLKSGSLTTKGPGDAIEAGEFLGVMGSSGRSSDPHLHLEFRSDASANSTVVDPYAGDCNATVDASAWATQEPQRASRVNAVFTHATAPQPFGCPTGLQDPRRQDAFEPGDVVYATCYLRDLRRGQPAQLTVTSPTGETVASFRPSTDEDFNASYWYVTVSLTDASPRGDYVVRATHGTDVVEHVFTNGTVSSAPDARGAPAVTLGPNPAAATLTLRHAPAGATVRLYDVHGRTILTALATAAALPVGHLPRGTYVAHVSDVDGRPLLRERVLLF